jgi:nitrogen regulatory protein P-II 2
MSCTGIEAHYFFSEVVGFFVFIIWSNNMKMITAFIQPKRLDVVREALSEININGVTATEVKGFGRQKGHTELYRGSEFIIQFLPKVKLEIAITDEQIDEVVETISSACKINGGKIGDGKIFVSSLDQVVRIRTGETGPDAI